MKIKSIRTIALAVICIMAASCANSGSLLVSTPDEVKTMRQARAAYSAGGALVGGAAGYLIGKKSDNHLMGGIMGGLAGAAIGDALGQKAGEDKIQAKRTAKATEEQLVSDIAAAQKFNTAARSYNSRLRNEIAELRKSKSESEQNRMVAQANMAMKEYDSQIETLDQYIANPANSGGASRMRSQRGSLQNSKSELERQIAQVKAVKTLEMQ
ncbi:MAG TPA: hypothetical protein VLO11_07725 [Luteolibacter sp.]|nr:hypothetical protein [Luteolibacter sp.]